MDVIKNMNQNMRNGILVESLALLFCILSMSLPQWYTNKKGHVGLFKMCSKVDNYCHSYEAVPDWVDSSRATIIMGMCCQCVCIAICLMYSFKMKDKTYFPRIAFFASLIAGVLIDICFCIAAYKRSEMEKKFVTKFSLGASFYLAIHSTVLSLVAGFFLFWSYPENNISSRADVATV